MQLAGSKTLGGVRTTVAATAAHCSRPDWIPSLSVSVCANIEATTTTTLLKRANSLFVVFLSSPSPLLKCQQEMPAGGEQ